MVLDGGITDCAEDKTQSRGEWLRHQVDDYADLSGSELLVADGFDEAIIGIERDWKSDSDRVAYDLDMVLEILQKHGMTYPEAVEYFEFNIAGAYLGEHTPVWVERFKFPDDE